MSLSEITGLSTSEIIVIGLGLLIGYWIVSKLIASSKPRQHSSDQTKPKGGSTAQPSDKPYAAQQWWEILRISQRASIPDIHHAYETLRMSYMPINRDRSISISSEANERLQELDRAFRLALESKKTPEP
jgi:hypothetical protein